MPPSGVQAEASRRPIVALVNNMPDGAFLDTEEQFTQAVRGSGLTHPPDLVLYSLPGLVRSEPVTTMIEARYRPLEELWSEAPDALIITGTEPSQSSLQYEPYWPQLARLLQWAADSVPATMLSCLASHASVLLFDGIERVPLPAKRHGVFSAVPPDRDDPLAAGLPQSPCMPHSRINDVPTEAMIAAGYSIVVSDESTSWSVATRHQGHSAFVLCQGHPEYSPVSLLREYRRDVRRALLSRAALPYPEVPGGYLDAEAVAELNAFRQLATAPGADRAALWESFPYDSIAARVQHSWADTAAGLYANWLSLSGASLSNAPAGRPEL